MYAVFMMNDQIQKVLSDALGQEIAPCEMENDKRQLRGNVYYGRSLLKPYHCDRITICESQKWGFQELHLHGLKPIKQLDEIAENYYREGLDQGFDPIEMPLLYRKSESLQITVSGLEYGTYSDKLHDYNWTPFEKVIRFFGKETMRTDDHIVYRAIDPLAESIGAFTGVKLKEQSFLRKILPPQQLPEII